MDVKLKPCPFCGSEKADWQDHPKHCYLNMITKQVESQGMHYCKEDCERAWNIRPIETYFQAETERLRKECRQQADHNAKACNSADKLQAENEKLRTTLKASGEYILKLEQALKGGER